MRAWTQFASAAALAFSRMLCCRKANRDRKYAPTAFFWEIMVYIAFSDFYNARDAKLQLLEFLSIH